jgi:murein DD-endopeptidase MepM/ murein hydrolase activator NlpD
MRRFCQLSILFCICVWAVFFFAAPSHAQESVDELRRKIQERTDALQKIEQEISQYRQQITTTSAEARTLKSAVDNLTLTEQKLRKDITAMESRIDITGLNIQKLGQEISITEGKIDLTKNAIARSLRDIASNEGTTLTEIVLNQGSIADAWNKVEEQRSFQNQVRIKTNELSDYKLELIATKAQREGQKKSLEQLKVELDDRKKLVNQNKAEKSTLLSQTKNKEAEYQRMLADSLRRKEAFEREIREIESAIKIQIDPSSIPKFGSGVLKPPLPDMFITQEFGDTAFSRANALVYNGRGHNGVDFRAAPGTNVMAALNGTVAGTGDTDLGCPRASYGKWVLITHPNGLSTLYAHLSSIKVAAGQAVTTGQTIGYSGNTGYSTGPHLHFTVYATQGVKIITRPSVSCGRNMTLPVADLKAYLNPLSYL